MAVLGQCDLALNHNCSMSLLNHPYHCHLEDLSAPPELWIKVSGLVKEGSLPLSDSLLPSNCQPAALLLCLTLASVS